MEQGYQMSLFDMTGEWRPGAYVETHGKRLFFDDLRPGMNIVEDISTDSLKTFQALRVISVVDDYAVCDSGRRHRSYLEKMFTDAPADKNGGPGAENGWIFAAEEGA